MYLALFFLASLVIALLRGGRISNLATVQVRFAPLLFFPLLVQIIAFSSIGDMVIFNAPLAQFLYMFSLACAVIALWFNRHLPGVFFIALGLFSNFLVIALNGGFMPVSAAAREFAGQAPLYGRYLNVIPLTETTVLPWLADILPLPKFLPNATVLSIGDVLLIIGGIIFIQRTLVHPPSTARTPAKSSGTE